MRFTPRRVIGLPSKARRARCGGRKSSVTEDRSLQSPHDPLDASAKITLRMFRRFSPAPEHEKPRAPFLLRQRVRQRAMALPHVRVFHARMNGSAPEPREEAPPLFPGRFAAALVLFRERGQKLRLGVEAEGAAVVGVGSNLRMALEHVQKF